MGMFQPYGRVHQDTVPGIGVRCAPSDTRRFNTRGLRVSIFLRCHTDRWESDVCAAMACHLPSAIDLSGW